MFKDNQKKYNLFREEFNFFIYESYHIEEHPEELKIRYSFNLGNRYTFHPTLRIVKKNHVKANLPTNQLSNLVFNIGLIELISYWKAACPRKIIVKPHFLTPDQIDFWKKIYFFGLGEFFYTNGITAKLDDFVEIFSESDNKPGLINQETDEEKVMVPVGGGKDSIVTLELLKEHVDVVPFILNPRQASLDTCFRAGFERNDVFEVYRTIDPLLLKLNAEGFLNGHTPFSALLGFVSVLAAQTCGAKYIALSNESSANEPTVVDGANHQYSKSWEFESDFRKYVFDHVSHDIVYFSFLRPLSEYQIASIFSKYPKYFPVFKSCNAGSKADTWCGACPKCLFTYIILSPFVSNENLVNIFGKDLFQDEKMQMYLNELTGHSPVKPFECVGTTYEVNFALAESLAKSSGELPKLLSNYKTSPLNRRNTDDERTAMLLQLNDDHYLPVKFLDILKSTIHG